MPAQSISIRRVDRFDIPEGRTPILKNGLTVGAIEDTGQTLTVEGVIFKKYVGKYNQTFQEDIWVFDPLSDDLLEINQYQKAFDFNIFYSVDKRILFSDTTTPITKKFLHNLKGMAGVEVDYSALRLDFLRISDMMPQTRGVRFNSDDQGVSSKSFSGDEVDSNNEASEALENDHATQIVGNLDILGLSRTIMLTQSGTLLVYTPLNDLNNREYPMLEFALATLRTIRILD
ncbi:hypothetical protein ACQUFH_11905 [Lactococcus lactis]|uniref:hypothetical protein n=1 Tax=Lactococcus lactis TaxID=1358 RepID=UPI003D0B48F6